MPTRERRIHRRAVCDSYLTSRVWRDRRRAWYAAWLTRAGTPPTCRVCDCQWSPKSGHLHHLTYARIGHEDDTDLIPLCSRDHHRLHEVMERSHSWRRLGRAQASFGIIALLRRRLLTTREAATQPAS
jgi:predicted HNH restriction endonuclease